MIKRKLDQQLTSSDKNC